MAQRTPLYPAHVRLNAKIVDFGGWDMPLHYGSQIEEHHQVRRHCGMFDVSHMAIVDIQGREVRPFLRHLLANDVAKLDETGMGLYSGMLNPAGGVIDDLIAYALGSESFRLVVNCATRDKDLAWMNAQAVCFDVAIRARPEMAMIAIQGPQAVATLCSLMAVEAAQRIANLRSFRAIQDGDWFFARTGYTGEDGVEVILPADKAEAFWWQLHAAGVAPAGLGARDTLRLEAGLNLYGHEMDEDVSPLEANMGWTIAWEPPERDFVGRAALAEQRRFGARRQLVGLVMTERGVLRAEQRVRAATGEVIGMITSGTFSPTLGCAIALARIAVPVPPPQVEVEVRNKWLPVEVTQPAFVRRGQKLTQQN